MDFNEATLVQEVTEEVAHTRLDLEDGVSSGSLNSNTSISGPANSPS